MTLLFTIHLAVTWMLAGLIWVIQVLAYPQYYRAGEAEFEGYHFAHCLRIGLIATPLLFAEALTAAWLVYEGHRELPFVISVGLIPVIWLSTAFLQAPLHIKLMKGFDAGLVRRVILTNWVRTLAWTARGVLVSAVVCQ